MFEIPVGFVAEEAEEEHRQGAAEIDGEEDQRAGVGEGFAEAAEKSELAHLAADLAEEIAEAGVRCAGRIARPADGENADEEGQHGDAD